MLRDTLLALPEPVLVVSHKNPDPDGVSAVQTILWLLRWEGKECFTHIIGTPLDTADWMYEVEDMLMDAVGDPLNALENVEGGSLVVVDCQPDKERLGYDPRSLGVSTVISIDHHIDQIHKHDPDNGSWVVDVPSTGCVLIQSKVVHPILYAGLHADTVGFKYRTMQAMHFAQLLQGLCNQNPMVHSCDVKLTDELIEQYHQLLMPRMQTDTLIGIKLMEMSFFWFGSHKMLIAATSSDNVKVAKEALLILQNFADTTVICSRKSGNVSFRTKSPILDVSKIAAQYSGGGHIKASGCNIHKGYVNSNRWWDFKLKLVDDVGDQLEAKGESREVIL